MQEEGRIPALLTEVWDALTSGPGSARWLGADLAEPMAVGTSVRLRYRPGAIGTVKSIDHNQHAFSVDFGATVATITMSEIPPADEESEPQTQIDIVETPDPGDADEVGRAWRVALGAAFLACWLAVGARDPRQAVVFVHGIGEQHPGSTARSMADAVFGANNYYSKPDRVSGSYELRRLQIKKNEGGDIPRTDVFELYWGDKIRDTTLSQVTGWLWRLARRPFRSVSSGFRPLWWLSRSLAVVIVVALALLVITIGTDGISALWGDVSRVAQLWWVSAIVSAVLGAITGWLVYSLGDAARYLSPHPANIKVRTDIRDAGINLLARLHEDPRYHRIVVAGHSLGSVVAYDVLLYYWASVNTRHGHLHDHDDKPVETYEASAPAAEGEDHQALQLDLWKGLRHNGVPWLVTDFVTFGAPLAHAGTLVASSPEKLTGLKDQRVLASCPPAPDKSSASHPYSYRQTYLSDQGTPSIRVLHHAALFGPTRWTNLYAPVTLGVLGDIIGGRVAPAFGNGVKDVEVRFRKRFTRLTLKAHTAYWSHDSELESGGSAADLFKEALRVDSLSDLKAIAKSTPLTNFLRDDDGLLPPILRAER